MRLTVDSSAFVSIFVPEKYSITVRQIIEGADELYTLDLAPYEIGNALRKAFVRGEIKDEEEVRTLLGKILMFLSTVEIHKSDEVLDEALVIGLKYGISIYDASFLMLARKLNSKFLTVDEKLIRGVNGTPYSDLIYPLQ
ncbi:MAG: type II toxin-antitoxin system VapC family toxin [Sulfolobus sp.]|nr:type II toxin-antitoxin system VapC family toxin [Sulfolobus sp.]